MGEQMTEDREPIPQGALMCQGIDTAKGDVKLCNQIEKEPFMLFAFGLACLIIGKRMIKEIRYHCALGYLDGIQ